MPDSVTAVFKYKKRVPFFDTDAMGVVHHRNYIGYFEEARVAWLREKKLIDIHVPRGPYVFAVVDLQVQYRKPARFDDEIEIYVRVYSSGFRIHFDYAIRGEAGWLVTGSTDLVPLNQSLKPTRLPASAALIFNEGANPPGTDSDSPNATTNTNLRGAGSPWIPRV